MLVKMQMANHANAIITTSMISCYRLSFDYAPIKTIIKFVVKKCHKVSF